MYVLFKMCFFIIKKYLYNIFARTVWNIIFDCLDLQLTVRRKKLKQELYYVCRLCMYSHLFMLILFQK